MPKRFSGPGAPNGRKESRTGDDGLHSSAGSRLRSGLSGSRVGVELRGRRAESGVYADEAREEVEYDERSPNPALPNVLASPKGMLAGVMAS